MWRVDSPACTEAPQEGVSITEMGVLVFDFAISHSGRTHCDRKQCSLGWPWFIRGRFGVRSPLPLHLARRLTRGFEKLLRCRRPSRRDMIGRCDRGLRRAKCLEAEVNEWLKLTISSSPTVSVHPYSERSLLFVMIRIPFFSRLNFEMKPLFCKASARARLTSLSAIDGRLPYSVIPS